MLAPPAPADEQERLSQLRSLGILDTPPEERFDRVTRMARRIFDVPIALVSLVDENRQWFKACFGLEVRETERRISFCGHTILNKEALVIEDTWKDVRFADNPLVTGAPNIRFYAGHPLHTHGGQAVGTLCIIDREPRRFDQDDLAMLSDMAGLVEREIMAVQLAICDELTRISNRCGFLTLGKYSLDLCRRQLFPAMMIFFDLDRFKSINDNYGHAEGDRALKLFAEQMRESFRTSDLFARLGGDEFVALLTNKNLDAIHALISRFDAALQERCTSLDLPYSIDFSYGTVAFEPFKHSCVEDMLMDADRAMYTEKFSKPRCSAGVPSGG